MRDSSGAATEAAFAEKLRALPRLWRGQLFYFNALSASAASNPLDVQRRLDEFTAFYNEQLRACAQAITILAQEEDEVVDSARVPRINRRHSVAPGATLVRPLRLHRMPTWLLPSAASSIVRQLCRLHHMLVWNSLEFARLQNSSCMRVSRSTRAALESTGNPPSSDEESKLDESSPESVLDSLGVPRILQADAGEDADLRKLHSKALFLMLCGLPKAYGEKSRSRHVPRDIFTASEREAVSPLSFVAIGALCSTATTLTVYSLFKVYEDFDDIKVYVILHILIGLALPTLALACASTVFSLLVNYGNLNAGFLLQFTRASTPTKCLFPRDMILIAAIQIFIWAIFVQITLASSVSNATLYALPLGYVGASSLTYLLLLFLLPKIPGLRSDGPLKRLGNLGSWLMTQVIRLPLCWYNPTTLADFYFADSLGSFVFTLGNVAQTALLVGADGEAPMILAKMQSGLILPAHLVPYSLRLLQLLRGLVASRFQIHPYATNCVKYTLGVLSLVFRFLFRTSIVDPATGFRSRAYFHLWCLFATLFQIYSFVWDTVVDWALIKFERDSSDKMRITFLSRKLAHQTKKYLYAIMIGINAVCRASWILTAMPGWLFNDSYYWVTMSTTAVIEVLRRAMWWYLRLDSDQMDNSGGYRKVKMVPVAPRHTMLPGSRVHHSEVTDVDNPDDYFQDFDINCDSEAAQRIIQLMLK